MRALFSKSGNQCAFPRCRAQLIGKRDLLIAQVCHIEAASPDGPRFNTRMSDDERRSINNLMVLCYPHHREIDDDPKTFTIRALKGMKLAHEKRVKAFRVRDEAINKIALEMERYWKEVEDAKRSHPAPEFAVPVDSTKDGLSLFQELRELIQGLRNLTDHLAGSDSRLRTEVPEFMRMLTETNQKYEDIPHHQNPFENRNWETHALGTMNFYTRIEISLEQLETKFLEHYLKLHPNDSKARRRLQAVKVALNKSAESAGLAD